MSSATESHWERDPMTEQGTMVKVFRSFYYCCALFFKNRWAKNKGMCVEVDMKMDV